VYPLQLHLPLFMNRHVFVNFSPRGMSALSGTVTSWIITALSLQAVPAVPTESVPSGVVVVDGSGVVVTAVAVGRDKPGLVGARVEVTKRGGASVVASGAILMQDVRLKPKRRANIQIFFIH
jgi:hypothetical protein